MSAKSFANKTVSSKHYCKVCQDSGKPESEYRSHSTRETRDPNSRITCPILLAIECRFCHKAGHTVKYCSVLKEKKKDEARASRRVVSNPKPVAVEKVANFYDCLLEEENDVIEEFPEFSTNPATASSHQLNYAAALLAPQVVKEKEIVRVPMVKKSWVEMSMEDSDDEEEDGSAW